MAKGQLFLVGALLSLTACSPEQTAEREMSSDDSYSDTAADVVSSATPDVSDLTEDGASDVGRFSDYEERQIDPLHTEALALNGVSLGMSYANAVRALEERGYTASDRENFVREDSRVTLYYKRIYLCDGNNDKYSPSYSGRFYGYWIYQVTTTVRDFDALNSLSKANLRASPYIPDAVSNEVQKNFINAEFARPEVRLPYIGGPKKGKPFFDRNSEGNALLTRWCSVADQTTECQAGAVKVELYDNASGEPDELRMYLVGPGFDYDPHSKRDPRLQTSDGCSPLSIADKLAQFTASSD